MDLMETQIILWEFESFSKILVYGAIPKNFRGICDSVGDFIWGIIISHL